MKRVGVVGGTRGLGKALVDLYASHPNTYVYATARFDAPQKNAENVRWLSNVDISKEAAGRNIAGQYSGEGPLDIVFVTAGYFEKESLDKPNWDSEVKMYTINAIGPVFLMHHLVDGGMLKKGSKVVLVSSEAGSIGLRHAKEGGGMCKLRFCFLSHGITDIAYQMVTMPRKQRSTWLEYSYLWT